MGKPIIPAGIVPLIESRVNTEYKLSMRQSETYEIEPLENEMSSTHGETLRAKRSHNAHCIDTKDDGCFGARSGQAKIRLELMHGVDTTHDL